ncbi:MAG: guanylate kinase [Myxococcales bacterium]|nr:guanylate kinase [Myxococcales bacterium]HIK85001.1 guanylate kinase [Myxococcales bacterium]
MSRETNRVGAPDQTGHVFVIAAPSGTGKTTICQRILARDSRLRLSISHTTRPPRAGEEDGVHYQFVSVKEFRELREAKRFLEHAEYGGFVYGTSWMAIEEPLEMGQDVVLEIEVQGATQVRERRPSACLIFLLPPSLAVLEARLRGRATDSEDAIQRRMTLVDRELAAAKIFDYAVLNDDLEAAVEQVLEVIEAVRAGQGEAIAPKHGRAGVLARWNESQAP